MMDWMSQWSISALSSSAPASPCSAVSSSSVEIRVPRAGPRSDGDHLPQVGQRETVEPRHEAVMRHHQPALGRVHHVREHVTAIGRVERHEHRTEVVGGKPGEDHRAAGRQPGDDSVAFLDAEPLQRGRRGPDVGEALAIGPGAAVLEQSEATVRIAAGPRVQHGLEDAVLARRDGGIEPGRSTRLAGRGRGHGGLRRRTRPSRVASRRPAGRAA